MQYHKLLLATLVASSVTGCDGDSGSTDNTASTSQGETVIHGRVYDGPISDANVLIADESGAAVALTASDQDGYFTVNVDNNALLDEVYTITATKGDINLRKVVKLDDLTQPPAGENEDGLLVSHISTLEFAELDGDGDERLNSSELANLDNIVFDSRMLLVSALTKEVVDGHRALDSEYSDTYQYMKDLLGRPEGQPLPVDFNSESFNNAFNETVSDPEFQDELISVGVQPGDNRWSVETVTADYEESQSSNNGNTGGWTNDDGDGNDDLDINLAVLIEKHLPSTWELIDHSYSNYGNNSNCTAALGTPRVGSDVVSIIFYESHVKPKDGCVMAFKIDAQTNNTWFHDLPVMIRMSNDKLSYKLNIATLLVSARIANGATWEQAQSELNDMFKYEEGELDDFEQYNFYLYDSNQEFLFTEASLGYFSLGLDNAANKETLWPAIYEDFADDGELNTPAGKAAFYSIRKWARSGELKNESPGDIHYNFQVPTLKDHEYSFPEWLINRSSHGSVNPAKRNRQRNLIALDIEDQKKIEVTFDDEGEIEVIAIPQEVIDEYGPNYQVDCINLQPSALAKYGALICSSGEPISFQEMPTFPVEPEPIHCLYYDSSSCPDYDPDNEPEIVEDELSDESDVIVSSDLPLDLVESVEKPEDLEADKKTGTFKLNADNCAESVAGDNINCDSIETMKTVDQVNKEFIDKAHLTTNAASICQEWEGFSGKKVKNPRSFSLDSLGSFEGCIEYSSRVNKQHFESDLFFTSKPWFKLDLSVETSLDVLIKAAKLSASVDKELYLYAYDFTSSGHIVLDDTDGDNALLMKPHALVFISGHYGANAEAEIRGSLKNSFTGKLDLRKDRPYEEVNDKTTTALDVNLNGNLQADLRLGVRASIGNAVKKSGKVSASASAFFSSGPTLDAEGRFNIINTAANSGDMNNGLGFIYKWLNQFVGETEASFYNWSFNANEAVVISNHLKAFRSIDSFQWEKVTIDNADHFRVTFWPTLPLPTGQANTGYYYEMKLFEYENNFNVSECRNADAGSLIEPIKKSYSWAHDGEGTTEYIKIPEPGFQGFLCIDMYHEDDDGKVIRQSFGSGGGVIFDGHSYWDEQPRSIHNEITEEYWEATLKLDDYPQEVKERLKIEVVNAVTGNVVWEVPADILSVEVDYDAIRGAGLVEGQYYLKASLDVWGNDAGNYGEDLTPGSQTGREHEIKSEVFFVNYAESTCSFNISFDNFNLNSTTLPVTGFWGCFDENGEGLENAYIYFDDEEYALHNRAERFVDFRVRDWHSRPSIVQYNEILGFESQGHCRAQKPITWSDAGVEGEALQDAPLMTLDTWDEPKANVGIWYAPGAEFPYSLPGNDGYKAILKGAWVEVTYNTTFKRAQPSGNLIQLVPETNGSCQGWVVGSTYTRCNSEEPFGCLSKFESTTTFRFNAAAKSHFIPNKTEGATYEKN